MKTDDKKLSYIFRQKVMNTDDKKLANLKPKRSA